MAQKLKDDGIFNGAIELGHITRNATEDLKTTRFKPEYFGKMNFYLSAVDDQLRHADDKLSIGLILCKTRSRVIAEYALRNIAAPVGVARYMTKLVESLPVELKDSLPSPKALEAELESQGRKPNSTAADADDAQVAESDCDHP